MSRSSGKSPTAALHGISDFAGISQFVLANPKELPDLEYKPLFTISTCAKASCTYCSIPKKRDADLRLKLAKASVAFANKEGGWLIVGAVRYNTAKGLHRLEGSACRNHPYTPEEVQTTIETHSTPAIAPRVRSFESPNGTPVFLVRVDAGTRLFGVLGPNGHEILMRHELSNLAGRADEIELQVLVKEQVESNREFREHVRHECMEILNGVVGTVGPAHRYPRDLLESSDFGFAFGPGSGEQTIQHLYGLESVDVVHRLPRDVTYFLNNVAALESTFHGRLSAPEAKLVALVKGLVASGASMETLSVMREVVDRAEDKNENAIHRGLAQKGLSYSKAFDAISASTRDRFLGKFEKRVSVFRLADTIQMIVPCALEVLRFYERVKAEYGTYAVSESGVTY